MNSTEELIKNIRRDIWDIRRLAKEKVLSPYDLCRTITNITTRSLKEIREYLEME